MRAEHLCIYRERDGNGSDFRFTVGICDLWTEEHLPVDIDPCELRERLSTIPAIAHVQTARFNEKKLEIVIRPHNQNDIHRLTTRLQDLLAVWTGLLFAHTTLYLDELCPA